jgi:hypothetical protein
MIMSVLHVGNFHPQRLQFFSESPPLTRWSIWLTTSCGLVTCQLARVRLLRGPTAVVNTASGLIASSTGGAASQSLSTRVTESGASRVALPVVPDGKRANARNMSSSVYPVNNFNGVDLYSDGEPTLSSPAQKTNSASGFLYNIRLTISPLFTAIGRTSRFFFPSRTE